MNEQQPAGNPLPLRHFLALTVGALGVVYGDIGTSPLYAVRECFHGTHAINLSEVNVFGVLSLVFWSLTVVVSLKYVGFIMLADNKGEGGIFSLLELIPKEPEKISPRLRTVVVFFALFGAALLYGDGVITPAISVLSAVEGLKVATEAAAAVVVPITCLILFLLFMIQSRGTGTIGKFFGPVMIVWFVVIGIFGLRQILRNPHVLYAVNPSYAVEFFALNRFHGLVVLSSVVLCITGGEALYADMGHFGRRPIRISWIAVVCPSLLMNYFGQGAGLLLNPGIASNPFYGIVPKTLLYPMVILSSVATVIASQAMISGVFSLTVQAIQLGYSPRMQVIHTSSHFKGQIYIEGINFLLMWACIGLVVIFKESGRLAAAYGIAVTATMSLTSIIYFFVIRRTWEWPLWKALPVVSLFLLFDLTYFCSNLLKFVDGGWLTVSIAVLVVMSMSTWKEGRRLIGEKVKRSLLPIKLFLQDVRDKNPYRVKGTAVFMSVSPDGTPITLLHHFKHNKVFHERVLLLTIQVGDTPYVSKEERVDIEDLGLGFYRVRARYGFMESPNVVEVIEAIHKRGLKVFVDKTTFYLGRETLLTTGTSRMMNWRKKLFALMSRNAQPPTIFFNIPPGRVVELGAQIEL